MATTQRVKKMKVMQSNGQFSNFIPLGADAKYIDLDNGRNLQAELNFRDGLTVNYYANLPTINIPNNTIGYVKNNSVETIEGETTNYYKGYYIFDNTNNIWNYNEAWIEVIEDIDNILVRLDTGEGVI